MFDVVVKSISDFFSNPFELYPITIVFLVGLTIQGLKVVIDLFRYRKFRLRNLFIAGGFPSFHSGLSACVTTLAFLSHGFDSVVFAITFLFSLLFAYDAMNLRFQAGQHAHYINKLRGEIGNILETPSAPYTQREKLSERIGHTPWEVFGGVFVGFFLTLILYHFSNI